MSVKEKTRLHLLDALRGVMMINMIAYHGMWNLVNLFGVRVDWYAGTPKYIWQQCICWSFILLSGFCWSLGKKKLKNALVTLGASVIITVVTAVFMKNSIILFGVLSLLGSSMLLMIPLDKLLKKLNPFVGLAVFFVLFIATKNISDGFVGVGEKVLFDVPRELYANYLTAYLGFPFAGFYSSDYFPLIPWLFLFVCGYFLHHIFNRLKLMKCLSSFRCSPLEFLGRHSLIIYMVHQPVVYVVLFLIFTFV